MWSPQTEVGGPGLGRRPVLTLPEDHGPDPREVGSQPVDRVEQVEDALLGHHSADEGQQRAVPPSVLAPQPFDGRGVHDRVHVDAHRDALQAPRPGQVEYGPLGRGAVHGDGVGPPEGQPLGRPQRALVQGEHVTAVHGDHDGDLPGRQHADQALGQHPVGVHRVVAPRAQRGRTTVAHSAPTRAGSFSRLVRFWRRFTSAPPW